MIIENFYTVKVLVYWNDTGWEHLYQYVVENTRIKRLILVQMKTENKRRYRFLVCKEQEWEHFILHCTVVGDYQCLIEI